MSKNIQLPIYLDYASTTPVDPRVAEKISSHLKMDGVFGNPASRSHKYGWKAEEAVEEALEAARQNGVERMGSPQQLKAWMSLTE